METVVFGLSGMVCNLICPTMLCWVRHELFSKRARGRKKKQFKFELNWKRARDEKKKIEVFPRPEPKTLDAKS
jgi:hypothetical protein